MNVDSSAQIGISFCSGVGGLELGLKLALGERYRCIAYCEREAFAAGVLAARMADGTLDEGVIWDDLVTFPSELFSDRVDIFSAGIPCQPHSLAGQRKGLADERWIWPDVARAIRTIRPRFVFLENVAGFVTSGGLDAVIGDLCALGYDTEWDVFSAEETGAPHRRQRWFCLAYARHDGEPQRGIASQRQQPGGWRIPFGESPSRGRVLADTGGGLVPEPGRGSQGRNGTGPAGATVGNPEGGTRLGSAPGVNGHAALADEAVANAEGIREREPNHETDTGTDRWTAGRIPGGCRVYPPARNDYAGWAAVDPSLEPAVRRDADGLATGLDQSLFAYRADRLRAVGNGVVPLSVALAWIELNRRIGGA